jgi:carnitine 3-dehydrogenase
VHHATIQHPPDAVVGTGTIGMSWAATLLSRGLEVSASDPAPEVEARLRHFIDVAWPCWRGSDRSLRHPRIICSFFVQMRNPLSPEPILSRRTPPSARRPNRSCSPALTRFLAPRVVIASSSSGLLISRPQAACRRPERVVIGHPFNPPHLIPLVEIVGGVQTAPVTIERAIAFYSGIGKRPIRIRREVAGHIANRLQAALWREAVHLVAAGVASVADVDTAISEGPGLRWALMGPHLTFHLAGGSGGLAHFLNQLGPPLEGWWDDLGSPRLTPEVRAALAEGVAVAAGTRDIAVLAAERDRFLIDLLALKKNAGRRV